MKFEYPFKMYLLGIVISSIIGSFGFYNLFIVYTLPIILAVVYVLLFICIFVWFSYYLIKYKNVYISINEDSLTFINNNKIIEYKNEDILKIIHIKNSLSFSIEDRLYFYTKNNETTFITDDIKHFNSLVNIMKNRYPEKYEIKENINSQELNTLKKTY